MNLHGIEALPSGNVRLRIQWRRHRIRGVFPSVNAAVEMRDAVLRELFDGRMAHRDDHDGLCGLSTISPWPSCGGVYFCTVPHWGRVKIGFGSNIDSRLRRIRCGTPGLVLLAHVPGDRRVERALHERFSALKIEGEWFRLEGRLLAHVRGIR